MPVLDEIMCSLHFTDRRLKPNAQRASHLVGKDAGCWTGTESSEVLKSETGKYLTALVFKARDQITSRELRPNDGPSGGGKSAGADENIRHAGILHRARLDTSFAVFPC